MQLTTPEQLTEADILFTQTLEPVRLRDSGTLLGTNDQMGTTPANTESMVVSIGRPEVWPLSKLLRAHGTKLPAEIAVLTNDADFLLIRTAFSIQPLEGITVERLQFQILLQSANQDNGPIAFDLHPREVFNHTEGHIKVAIAPNLQFNTFALGVGEAQFELTYSRLEPVIIGAGIGQANPNWTFQPTTNHPLVGSRFTYIIVKCMRDTKELSIAFDIVCKIAKPGQFGWLLRTRKEEQASRLITLRISD